MSQTSGRQPLTHFLCLPLVNEGSRPQLESQWKEFKDGVCNVQGGLPSRAIRPLGSIHLTLGVMSLSDPGRLKEAVEFLESRGTSSPVPAAAVHQDSNDVQERPHTIIDQTSSAPSSLKRPITPPQVSRQARQPSNKGHLSSKTAPTISLTSLKAMHSPSATTILYAVPDDPTDQLYTLASHLRDQFTQSGFLIPDSRPLKLHATIINTIYVKGRDRVTDSNVAWPQKVPEGTDEESAPPRQGQETVRSALQTSGKKTRSGPMRIDARELMERYGEHVWARDVVVDKVAICEMGAKDVVDERGEVVDQVYREVASVPFVV
ncbi:hypothetical protein CAC42_4980 [Sphaceloma murrayae]|uniref:A-kinase anchor protein 7-like phosphoesterase domain-containing protein n=1 Tax=Sphaceloma murrayae TaxID=2082308 RepID=A0A2K1QPH8_9PEZI|nr:hypothetical protein CAC42_4980 [Sphaceloma murrayae]